MSRKRMEQLEIGAYFCVSFLFFFQLAGLLVIHSQTGKKASLSVGIPVVLVFDGLIILYFFYQARWRGRKKVRYQEQVVKNNQKIAEIIKQCKPEIPVTIQRIAELANFTRADADRILKRVLKEYPLLGDYLEFEQVFIRKIKTDELLAQLTATCYYCGVPLEKDIKVCPDCGGETLSCSVCKLPISFGEEVGQCSLCEAKGHLVHLLEWLKTNGRCPVCLQELPLEGIVILEPFEKKKGEGKG